MVAAPEQAIFQVFFFFFAAERETELHFSSGSKPAAESVPDDW